MPHQTRTTALPGVRTAARRTPIFVGVAASLALMACGRDAGEKTQSTRDANASGAGVTADSAAHPASHAVAGVPDSALAATVYKSPTCGCCAAWVDHLRANGFRVTTVDREDLAPVKAAHGVGEHLASCHTTLVGGYVVEGHVPAADIRRLLRERPAVAGIAVPGMPTGSPGMEVPGARADRYDVVSFDRAGATRVFASH